PGATTAAIWTSRKPTTSSALAEPPPPLGTTQLTPSLSSGQGSSSVTRATGFPFTVAAATSPSSCTTIPDARAGAGNRVSLRSGGPLALPQVTCVTCSPPPAWPPPPDPPPAGSSCAVTRSGAIGTP